jgi:hypothetical protein
MIISRHSLLTLALSGRHFKKREMKLVRTHQNPILVLIKHLLHLNVRILPTEGVKVPHSRWENFLKRH